MAEAPAPRVGERAAPPGPADLARHPVLAGLSVAQQREVLVRADALRLGRDETLFQADEPARHFFLCRSGQLKLYRLAPTGSEKIVGMVDAGSSFAEAAAFMQRRTYPVSCTAVRASELVRFNARHLVGLLRESPDSCLGLLGIVSTRLASRVADIEALSLQNAQLRIVNYLVRQRREAGGDAFGLPASKKHVAGLLAVSPETLSRVLALLQERRILAVDRRRLRVLDHARLVAVAEGRETL